MLTIYFFIINQEIFIILIYIFQFLPFVNQNKRQAPLISQMSLRKSRAPQGKTNLNNQKSATALFGKTSDMLSTNVQLQNPSLWAESKCSFSFQPQKCQRETQSSAKKFPPPLQSCSPSDSISQCPSKSKQVLSDSNFTQSKRLLRAQQIKDQTGSREFSSNTDQFLSKVRRIYKFKSNVKKIVDAWGFENAGHIDSQKIQEMAKKHFQSSLSIQEAEGLIRTFNSSSKNEDSPKMSTLSFISMIYDSDPFIKPNIKTTNALQSSENSCSLTLKERIKHMSESTLNLGTQPVKLRNSSLVKLPKVNASQKASLEGENRPSESFGQSQVGDRLSKTSPLETFMESRLQSQPSLYQTMQGKSSPKFTFNTTKSHGVEFDPRQMQGTNQQKLRFGATPLLELKDQTKIENKREKLFDEKAKIMDSLNQNRNLEKARYANKLERIRHHQHREKENIERIEERVQNRNQANMQKISEENLAYNYVNFLHNQWK